MSKADFIDWGLTYYKDAFNKQLELVRSRIQGFIPNTLVFTEHKPVFTIGKRKGSTDNLLWNATLLENEGIEVSETNRGGDITYHGPGQIVTYPIISLDKKKDLHQYLRDLEQVLINVLGCHGLIGSRVDGKTGIWMKDRKIAAMGVAVKKWVTYHGFALNVNNSLDHFEGIIPCGISKTEGSVTSMKKELGLGSNLDLQEIKHTIAVEFWKIFTNG